MVGALQQGPAGEWRRAVCCAEETQCWLESEEGIMSTVSRAGWGLRVVSIHPDQGNQGRLPNGGDMGAGSQARFVGFQYDEEREIQTSLGAEETE